MSIDKKIGISEISQTFFDIVIPIIGDIGIYQRRRKKGFSKPEAF